MDGNYFKVSNEFIEYLPKLSGNAAKVYILFRKMINEKNNGDEVWPSYTYICKNTGIARRTVSKTINELVLHGWISEIDKGFNSVNHYHVNNTSRANNELLQKRTSRAKNALGRANNELPVGQNLPLSRAKNELEVGQNMNSNNTNITTLINKTNLTKLNNKGNAEKEFILDMSMTFDDLPFSLESVEDKVIFSFCLYGDEKKLLDYMNRYGLNHFISIVDTFPYPEREKANKRITDIYFGKYENDLPF